LGSLYEGWLSLYGDGAGNPWPPGFTSRQILMADIEVEFTDEEYARIEKAAALNGETVQEFCERAVKNLFDRLGDQPLT
jgi:hypothetical protein